MLNCDESSNVPRMQHWPFSAHLTILLCFQTPSLVLEQCVWTRSRQQQRNLCLLVTQRERDDHENYHVVHQDKLQLGDRCHSASRNLEQHPAPLQGRVDHLQRQ